MPPPVLSGAMGMTQAANQQTFSDMSATDALALDTMWANSSFDILDTLWTQTDNAWPAQ